MISKSQPSGRQKVPQLQNKLNTCMKYTLTMITLKRTICLVSTCISKKMFDKVNHGKIIEKKGVVVLQDHA